MIFLNMCAFPAKMYLTKGAVDVSGHVICQMGLNLLAFKAMQGLEETGTPLQKRTFLALHAGIAVTDGAWMYSTVTKHHSVADAIGALISCGVAYSGIEGSKIVLNKVYDKAYSVYDKAYSWYNPKSPEIIIDEVSNHEVINDEVINE